VSGDERQRLHDELAAFAAAAGEVLTAGAKSTDVLNKALRAAVNVLRSPEGRSYDGLYGDPEEVIRRFGEVANTLESVLVRAKQYAERGPAAPAAAAAAEPIETPDSEGPDPLALSAAADLSVPDLPIADPAEEPADLPADPPLDAPPGPAVAHPDDQAAAEILADLLAELDAVLAGDLVELDEFRRRQVSGRSRRDSTAAARPDLLWQRLHLRLLRLEPSRREAWYRDQGVASIFPGTQPWDPEGALIPRAPGVHEGLSLAHGPGLGDWIPGLDGGPLAALARRADQALALGRADDELLFADPELREIKRVQPGVLEGQLKTQLGILAGRAGADGFEAARSIQALDALIGALIHGRIAARGSWWWTWRQDALRELDTLVAEYGYTVLGPDDLSTSMAVRSLTEGNHVGNGSPAATHWVLIAPLRSTRGDRETIKGRIVGPRASAG
jgi:hypothetical protein